MGNYTDAFLKIKCKKKGEIENAYFLEDEDIIEQLEWTSYSDGGYYIDKEKFILKVSGKYSYAFNFPNGFMNDFIDEVKLKEKDIEKLYFMLMDIAYHDDTIEFCFYEVDMYSMKIKEYYKLLDSKIFSSLYYFYLKRKDQTNYQKLYEENYLLFCSEYDEWYLRYDEERIEEDRYLYYEYLYILKFFYEKFVLFTQNMEKVLEIKDENLKEITIYKTMDITIKTFENYSDIFNLKKIDIYRLF